MLKQICNYYEKYFYLNYSQLSHTWTPSCSQAAVEVGLECFRKCLKIYSSVYLVSFHNITQHHTHNVIVLGDDELEDPEPEKAEECPDLHPPVLPLPLLHLLRLRPRSLSPQETPRVLQLLDGGPDPRVPLLPPVHLPGEEQQEDRPRHLRLHRVL